VRHRGPLSNYAEQRRDVNQRLRLAFILGAEDRSRLTLRRGLTMRNCSVSSLDTRVTCRRAERLPASKHGAKRQAVALAVRERAS
jgi:hypothetical protein